jgi:hypothetical protein
MARSGGALTDSDLGRFGAADLARLYHAFCFPVSCVAGLDGCRVELFADLTRRVDLAEPVPGATRLDMVCGGGALCVDIDVADLRGPSGVGCGCVGRKSLCGGCWPLVVRHAGLVTKVIDGVGLGPIHWWFSGGHGVHGFCFSAAATSMGQAQKGGLVRLLGRAGATIDAQVTVGANRKIRAPWSAYVSDSGGAHVGLYLGTTTEGGLWGDLGELRAASEIRGVLAGLGALRRNVEAFLGRGGEGST